MRIQYFIAILVLLAVGLLPAPAYAGGVVTVCDEAHLLAALAGGGTVTFACSGTITLTAEIVIAADTTIDGSGQAVTISGNDAVRVFRVNEGATVTLNKLVISHGYSARYGGGISNAGALLVSQSTLSGNNAMFGGGIDSYGTIIVIDSAISGNHATSSGGGIYSDRLLVVSNSTFSANIVPSSPTTPAAPAAAAASITLEPLVSPTVLSPAMVPPEVAPS